MGELTGLIAVVMIFSIPIVAILAGAYNKRHEYRDSTLSKEDRQKLAQLTDTAARLTERVQTLERILDAEVPNWRDEHERRA